MYFSSISRLYFRRDNFIIAIENISKSFSDQNVLRNISFSVKQGDALAIIGKSGIGKSVLLKHLNGLIAPDSGTVMIDDQEINNMAFKKLEKIRSNISMVFQFGALFDSMTVYENIALGLEKMTSLNKSEIKDRIFETLEEVGMEGSENRYPSDLSGGMKKRVGIARAIAVKPKYLLYDEPTTGLDPIMTDSINKLISKLHILENVTSIIVTHEMKTVYDVSKRVIMLHDGNIRYDGSSEDIRNSNDLVVQNFINGVS